MVVETQRTRAGRFIKWFGDQPNGAITDPTGLRRDEFLRAGGELSDYSRFRGLLQWIREENLLAKESNRDTDRAGHYKLKYEGLAELLEWRRKGLTCIAVGLVVGQPHPLVEIVVTASDHYVFHAPIADFSRHIQHTRGVGKIVDFMASPWDYVRRPEPVEAA